MVSTPDLDKGGNVTQGTRRYLGPSVGWVYVPDTVVGVTVAGTTTIYLGTTLVTIDVNGNVSIQLPSSKASTTASAGALPGPSIGAPITVVDIGGHVDGSTVLYTILPFGTEKIMGLNSIQIASPYGAFVLWPTLTGSGGWTQL